MSRVDFRKRCEFGISLGDFYGRFWVEGPDGAVELQFRESRINPDRPVLVTGGIEYHATKPSRPSPPDHARCSAVSDRPCWHDGSSLAADPYIQNRRPTSEDREWIWTMLEARYLDTWGPRVEEGEE